MSGNFCFPQNLKVVEALCPQAQGTLVGDYVSLKDAQNCWIVVHTATAAANAIPITVEQATVVAGTDSKVITKTCPIWVNDDCATTDTLVRDTDAVGYNTGTTSKHRMVVIQVNPATLDTANGFDCITVKIAPGSASNIVEAMYYLEYRYAGDGKPSAILD